MPPTTAPPDRRVHDARDLVRAMHEHHARRWFRTLRFKQTVTWTDADGSTRPPEVWTEHAHPPGRLRVDFGEGRAGDGVLYADGRRYVFRGGAVASAPRRTSHPALLSFDVPAQPPERTIEVLERDGFDLSRLRADTWEGRPVHVAGAASPDDLRSPQFWVDAKTLLPVRLVEPAPEDPARTSEVRFGAYVPAGAGWVATEVVFLLDGREVMREGYFDVEADVDLAPALFDPGRWGEAGSWERFPAG